ncbi:hypothetical protein YC2023_118866 [Brassica napus]
MRIFTYSAFICASFWSGKRLDFQQSGLIILCILLVRRTNTPNQLLVRIRGSGWCGESIGWYLSRDGLRITSTCQCLMEIFHCRHSRDKFS